MVSDYKPIMFNAPETLDYAELYFLHDLQYGNEYFDAKKWKALKQEILGNQRAYCVFIGDLMENATPNSKSDIFYQTATPQEQMEWIAAELKELAPKTIAVLAGNHERNRSTRMAGIHPLLWSCMSAGIEDRYREHFAFIDIGVGTRKDVGSKRQAHYVGYLVHSAKDQKNFHSADAIEGIDFFAFGHDHQPSDKPRGKLVYDTSNKTIRQKDVEVINCGAYLEYGGYAPDCAHRVSAQKLYTLILRGDIKKIDSRGFHI